MHILITIREYFMMREKRNKIVYLLMFFGSKKSRHKCYKLSIHQTLQRLPCCQCLSYLCRRDDRRLTAKAIDDTDLSPIIDKPAYLLHCSGSEYNLIFGCVREIICNKCIQLLQPLCICRIVWQRNNAKIRIDCVNHLLSFIRGKRITI